MIFHKLCLLKDDLTVTELCNPKQNIFSLTNNPREKANMNSCWDFSSWLMRLSHILLITCCCYRILQPLINWGYAMLLDADFLLCYWSSMFVNACVTNALVQMSLMQDVLRSVHISSCVCVLQWKCSANCMFSPNDCKTFDVYNIQTTWLGGLFLLMVNG